MVEILFEKCNFSDFICNDLKDIIAYFSVFKKTNYEKNISSIIFSFGSHNC